MPNSHTPSLTKVGMSSSRTNISSAGKFSTRAVRLFLPDWMRKPASRSSSRLASDRRPDFCNAMCRRVRSDSIAASQAVDGSAIALVGLLPEEAADTHDRGRADARAVVDLAIGQLGLGKQPRDMPPLGQRPDLGRRAQVEQEQPQVLGIPCGQQCLAEVIRELAQILG